MISLSLERWEQLEFNFHENVIAGVDAGNPGVDVAHQSRAIHSDCQRNRGISDCKTVQEE